MENYKKKYEEIIKTIKEAKESMGGYTFSSVVDKIIPDLKDSEDEEKPNGGIVLEDFNEGEGFYKVNLAYLNKEQVIEIEELVKKWNPELKESEDDKIVDAIRKALESKIEDLGNGVTKTACLAWLEKQGKKHIDRELSNLLNRVICRFINDPNIPYPERERFRRRLFLMLNNLKKQGEQKVVKFMTKSYITPNPEFFQWIYNRLVYQHHENPNMDYMHSLKERIEDMQEIVNIKTDDVLVKQKSAWSEEDEKMIENIFETIDAYYYLIPNYKEKLSWLKSLKERYTWKPSDLPHWKKSNLPNDNTTGFNSDYFCHKGYCINYKELFEKLPKDD